MQERTLPYKARTCHCYAQEAKVRLRIKEHCNKSVAVKFYIYFPNRTEIDSNKIGSLWLLSKTVSKFLPFFCATFVLNLVFS